MGKNKNHNRKRKKPLTVEAKSLNSNGGPCNSLPEREKHTNRGNIQNERKTFNKPASEILTHHHVPVTDSDKLKTDQTPVNETKSSFNKMCTKSILPITTSRAGYREGIENEWDDFFNGPSETNAFQNLDSQTLKSPLLVKDKIRPKVNTTANEASIKCSPNFNKVISQNVVSNSREDNSQTLSKEINPALVRDKMKQKVGERATNDTLRKGAISLNKEGTHYVSSNSREDINKPKKIIRNIEKPTRVSKFSNGNFSGCLEASISNGTRPKVNRPMYPETSKFSTQIVSNDLTKNLYESLNVCEEQYRNFQSTYSSWRKERLETIKKLEKLKNDVHNDQYMFNKTNALVKDLNVGSRRVKMENASNISSNLTTISIDYLTSLAALATDAASGITSIAQAFNIDSYMETFAKIMELDKEITKPLYAVRSLCLKQYQNVEEVYRKYHSDSFGNVVANVSKALSLEELWLDLKGDGKDKSCTIIDCVDKFFRMNLNKEAKDKVYNTIQDYSEKNPAALKACEAAGKVCYDIYDVWSEKPKKAISGFVSQIANKELLNHEIAELSELRSLADNKYKVQSNLESDISDAIEGLKEEMSEIDNNLKKFHYSFEEKIYGNLNQI